MVVTVTTDTTTVPGETIVKFTGSGETTWTCPTGITTIRYLVVGGGGGGRGYIAYVYGKGGGGGAEVLTGNLTTTPGNSLSVTVGAGGAENAFGAASVLDSVTARPGKSAPNSTGGASGNKNPAGVLNHTYWGGGGGGAGAAGSNAVGGAGVSSDITGTSTYYGGGGGGGTQDGGFGGPGGNGGGGTGAIAGVSDATAGTDGTGGGGGGGYWDMNKPGGKGGDGIVIIRYTNPDQVSSPTRSTFVRPFARPSLAGLSLTFPPQIVFGVG